MRGPLAWILLGVLGIVLAAGATLAASDLSSQRIGLSSEPLRAGDELAPASVREPASTTTATVPARRRRTQTSTTATTAPTPTTTRPAATAQPPPAVTTADGDDRGGRGRSGHDSDDD